VLSQRQKGIPFCQSTLFLYLCFIVIIPYYHEQRKAFPKV
jgi:hypothetical protein